MNKKINKKLPKYSKGLALPDLDVTAKYPEVSTPNSITYTVDGKTKWSVSDSIPYIFKDEYDKMKKASVSDEAINTVLKQKYNIKEKGTTTSKKLPKYAIGFGGYASKGLAGAGSGLSIGSNPLLMAATGGLSAPIGAALGAGVGILGASKEDQAMELAMQNEKIAGAVAMNKNINDQMQAEYNLKNQTNNRMPGFKKGKPGFKPNAMVSKGEVIKNGYTGSLNPMPGNFDPSNPDPLAVRINQADSIYPSDPMTAFPGGETHAQLAVKMSKAQDRAEKILSGKIKGGKLDKEEARRTLSTIEAQTKNFDKELAINNYGVDQQLPRYAKGRSGIMPRNAWNPNTRMPLDGVLYNEPGYQLDYEAKYPNQLQDLNVTAKRITKNNNIYSNTRPVVNQSLQNGMPNNTGTPPKKQSNTGTLAAKTTPASNTASNTSNKATQSSSKTPSTKSNTSVSTGNTVPQTASKGPSETSVKTPTIQVSQVGQDVVTNATQTYAQQSQGLLGLAAPYNPDLGKLQAPQLKAPKPTSMSAALDKIPEFSATGTSKTGKAPAAPGDSFAGMSSSTLGNIGSIASQLAPVVSNLFSGRPETFQPVYESYINPNQRYNISPYIQESLKQRQIARYNQSTNRGQGGSMAYGANIYAKGQEALSGIMNQADTANMGFAAQYADRFNQASASRANELRRINDLNARSRGASQDIKNAGLTQLSEFAQNQQLMSNQKNRDNMNMEIFGAYASAMDPKMLDQMKQIYAKYQGRA